MKYQKEKNNISKQLQSLRRRMEIRPEEKEQYASEAATLELTLQALDEKHKSLWGDEEEKQYPDPREAAENAEAPGEGSAVVDAASTGASVSAEG